MHIRTIALAAALPLALGIACKTGSAQKGTSSQAQTSSGTQDEGRTPTQARTGAQGSEQGRSSSGDVMAHSDDQIVSGRVTKVSEESVEIQSAQGAPKALQLVPQTSVMIDGRDAHPTELQEGQEVRASFNTVDGEDVAVEIRAGQETGSGSSGSSDSMQQGGAMNHGSQGTGSSEPSSGSSPSGSDTGAPSSASSGGSGSSDTSGSGRRY